MKISIYDYELIPKFDLNSKSKLNKNRIGFLMRVEFGQELVGYADCHPWEVFGDEPVENQKNILKIYSQDNGQKLTNILKRSLSFAELDAEARKEKKNLFSDLVVPKSHFTISDLNRWNANDTQKVVREGFDIIKVKMGRNLESETILLKAFIHLVERPERLQMTDKIPLKLRVRLDFNGSLTAQEFEEWWLEVKDWMYPILDYIEDPFVYDEKLWDELSLKYQINFAIDRAEALDLTQMSTRHVVVVKPAVDDVRGLINKSHDFDFEGQGEEELNFDFSVTSYMDHPVGQAFAAYKAACIKKRFPRNVLTCGLFSHHIYENNEFKTYLSHEKGVLKVKGEYGIGFDDLLQVLDWKEL